MNSGVKTIAVIAVIIIVALGVITTVGSYFNYNNQEVALREQAEAQRGKVEGVHDAMWKIISQKAQVSQDYRTSFDSIYTHIIGGRYQSEIEYTIVSSSQSKQAMETGVDDNVKLY